MKNQNKTFMVKTMGPSRDSRAPSWLPGPRNDVPAEPPLIYPVYEHCIDIVPVTCYNVSSQ